MCVDEREKECQVLKFEAYLKLHETCGQYVNNYTRDNLGIFREKKSQRKFCVEVYFGVDFNNTKIIKEFKK